MPELLQYPSLEEQTLGPQIEQIDFPEGMLFQPEHDEAAQVTPSERGNAVLPESDGANTIEEQSGPERSGWRDRFFRSRLGRTALAAVAGLGFAAGASVVDAAPAEASSDKVYTTTDNVYLHADPGLGDKDDLIKIMPKGTKFTADCYVNDTPIGKRNNPAWLHGTDETGATGYFTDAYSDSRWDRNNTLHDQGLAFCGEEKAPAENQKTTSGHDLQPAESIPVFTEYDRNAAASWARNHAKDTPPNAGSCTWFISKALWKGGIDETPEWNNDPRGVKRDGIRYGTDVAWKASEFLKYAPRLPFVEVHPLGNIDGKEKVPAARLGDVIIYDWNGNGSGDHATIITGFSENNPQYPLVSGWSEHGSEALHYSQRGWTWSELSKDWIAMKEPATEVYLIHFRTQDDIEIN